MDGMGRWFLECFLAIIFVLLVIFISNTPFKSSKSDDARQDSDNGTYLGEEEAFDPQNVYYLNVESAGVSSKPLKTCRITWLFAAEICRNLWCLCIVLFNIPTNFPKSMCIYNPTCFFLRLHNTLYWYSTYCGILDMLPYPTKDKKTTQNQRIFSCFSKTKKGLHVFFPKMVGFPPNHPIKNRDFQYKSIHFVVFLETPIYIIKTNGLEIVAEV